MWVDIILMQLLPPDLFEIAFLDWMNVQKLSNMFGYKFVKLRLFKSHSINFI